MPGEDIFSGLVKEPCPISRQTKVVLYGAGNIGKETAQLLQANGFELLGFLDNHKTGTLCGLTVLAPDKAPLEWKKCPVLVTVFNCESYSNLQTIESILLCSGFSQVVPFERFYQEYCSLFAKDFFWLTDPNFYRDHQKEISDAYALFNDEHSKHLYLELLHYRLGGGWRNLPPCSGVAEQYFDKDLIGSNTVGCFVDLGAFTGDTLEFATQNSINIKRVLAFEPDLDNYRKLCEFLQNRKDLYPDALAIPSAVGSRCGRISFCEDRSGSSHISHSASSQIPVVALDECYPNLSPDFIKMDIEGAELEALRGMRSIIETHTPILAVCVYHKPEDIFVIPLFLKALSCGYNFYLRLYGEHGFDTVLYAIPR